LKPFDVENLGRKIPAPLTIDFEEVNGENEERFKREYYSLSESDDDPIGQWLKTAQARGDTRNSDSVLLHLVIELHRKVDDLGKILRDEKPEYIKLDKKCDIDEIGHEFLIIKEKLFEVAHKYYLRVNLPVFPTRIVPIFIEAAGADIGKILMMHERDRKDWDGYITARERALIREKKGFENG